MFQTTNQECGEGGLPSVGGIMKNVQNNSEKYNQPTQLWIAAQIRKPFLADVVDLTDKKYFGQANHRPCQAV